MSAARVAVVLPVRDGARYLAEALDSVLAQTLADLDLVVVDDGSTDATPAILRGYAERDARVRVVQADGTGLADALNLGCRATECEYIARMDADDVALPDRLALQVAALSADEELAAVGGAVDLIDRRGRVVGHEDYPGADAEIRQLLLRAAPMVHPAVTIRRTALEAVGGYRRIFRHAEDYDLWLRLSEHGRLSNLPVTVLRYRLHPGQVSAHMVEEQARYSLVARAAADLRAAGRPDPLTGCTELDPQRLAALGVDGAALQAAGRDQWAWWAATMTAVGQTAAAANAWREAHRAAAATSPADRARLRWREAQTWREQGYRLRAARARLRHRRAV